MKADDLAGLEALVYWTHLCDRVRRKTDARLFVSNEYLSCRFGCIIEPTGFIMNKHTYIVNNYLSAGRNRFDLEFGPWTIRATRGKETLYQVPIKFAH